MIPWGVLLTRLGLGGCGGVKAGAAIFGTERSPLGRGGGVVFCFVIYSIFLLFLSVLIASAFFS